MRVIMMLLVVFILAACKQNNQIELSDAKSVQYVDQIELENAEDSTRNSIDWEGEYSGTIPCADCAGIETTLILFPDNTYELSSIYLDKNKEYFIEQGSFEWNKNGNTISINHPEQHKFKVGEGRIWFLDKDGKEIQGELAEKYILTKKR